MIDVLNPRIWLKAFWGFDPSEEGYLGFSLTGNRASFVASAQPGDLVLIYGATSSNTKLDERKQALGFLQVDLDLIKDTDRLSPLALKRKAISDYADRWTFAVPVRRAWKVTRPVQVRQVAPETYVQNRARVLASRGEMLTLDEALRALDLPVSEVSVFGEPPIAEDPTDEISLAKRFRPSRGLRPVYGDRESEYLDGDTFLYMLEAQGNMSALLGRDFGTIKGMVVVKVGFSNDPTRRCEEHNSTLPPTGTLKWKLVYKSKAFPDGDTAKRAEDALKANLEREAESLGGEFFFGDPGKMLTVFMGTPGVANVIRSMAMSRKRV